jgi:hypothetical protein
MSGTESFDRRTGIDERAETRAELLPEEEEAVSSADPKAQAREVLRDSERRAAAEGVADEHRKPEETA